MSKKTRATGTGGHNCSVVDCQNPDKNIFIIPSGDAALRNSWITFIFKGNVPVAPASHLFVCAKHFSPDCFANLGQYNAGLAKNLRREKGVVPNIRDPTTAQHTATTSTGTERPKMVDVGCQTEPQTTRTYGTQLSMHDFELQPHFRSKGTQTFMTSTPSTTPIKPQVKKARLELVVEEEGDSLGAESSSSVAPDPDDHSYNPEESSTLVSDSMDISEESSPTLHSPISHMEMRKLIVYESCLMELFEKCPLCTSACRLNKYARGTCISIIQRCPRCQYYRQWRSQPLIGFSTPAGNLQLSAAVFSGQCDWRRMGTNPSDSTVTSSLSLRWSTNGRGSSVPCLNS
ncbi:hypothetical protein GJAV_G00072340 [Gymnothorax javanicus]|nr:hypothetical protein GJAV_G00072340 [Gymnothorax javanicus]